MKAAEAAARAAEEERKRHFMAKVKQYADHQRQVRARGLLTMIWGMLGWGMASSGQLPLKLSNCWQCMTAATAGAQNQQLLFIHAGCYKDCQAQGSPSRPAAGNQMGRRLLIPSALCPAPARERGIARSRRKWRPRRRHCQAHLWSAPCAKRCHGHVSLLVLEPPAH